MLRKRSSSDDAPKANWLISYGCLMTQLLVFFVMLFALANKTTENQLKKIKSRVDEYIAKNNLTDRVRTDLTQKEKGLVISLTDKLMFESGKAELANPEAQAHIAEVMKLVEKDAEDRPYPNRVAVEGHTDNRPVKEGSPFKDNWDLSAARATNITRFLVETLKYEPQRLSSSGYAEWWPAEDNLGEFSEQERKTMAPADLVVRANDSLEKQARNRRVDIVVRRLEMWELQQWRETLMRALNKAVGKK